MVTILRMVILVAAPSVMATGAPCWESNAKASRGRVEPAIVLKRVAEAHQLVGTGVGSIWALAVS